MSFDVVEFRKSFPQLERKMGPNRLVYFDSGASSLKHCLVSDRVSSFNRFETSNVHRGAHQTSRQGTESFEGARKHLQSFVGAQSETEIVFTKGTTEGINFIASSVRGDLKPGDEIVITSLEHHSNIVPWQVLCEQTGAVLRVVKFDEKLGMDFADFENALSEKTKIASFIYYSNSMGNRLPVEKMVEACRKRDILTLVDAAQAVLTERIDVQKMKCDFLVLSGHKMLGPYGIGILYIREAMLDSLPPYQTGGSMIDRVTFEKTTYAEAPQKFEAGTPNIAGAIGLGVAAEILMKQDFPAMHRHVVELRNELLSGLQQRANVDVYNFESEDYTGVVSFNVKGSHPSDVGTLLDKYGFAVRAGHHCCQPLMELMGISGTVRVSIAPYNCQEEIKSLLATMNKIEEFF